MEVKDLYDQVVKEEIIHRLSKLTPDTRSLWGKMSVQQMLAHLQQPLLVAYGRQKPAGNFLMKLLGPLIKPALYGPKPYKRGLPTDKTYIVTDNPDFENERGKLIELVQEFREDNIPDEQHPLFGKMTKEQWSKSAWKHLDHHLQQFGV